MATTKQSEKKHPNLTARVLPHNNEAEQAILGCAMIDRDAPIKIVSELSADDFYSQSHRDIYTAMVALASSDQPIDIVTLLQECETMGVLNSVGGLAYLTKLNNVVPSAANFNHYLGIVKKTSLLRKLIASCQKVIDVSFTGDADDDVLRLAESEIFALGEKNDKSKLEHVNSALGEALERIELLHKNPLAARGIPTPFRGLNSILNGFQAGDLVLVAARPGQGKTSIAMNFITHAALNGERLTPSGKPDPYKCAVFSLEMPKMQLAKRLLCSVSKVDMTKANSGRNLTPEDWQNLFKAKTKLEKAHIYIDDSSLNTPIEVLSKCRRIKREKGLDLVMIDYLQLMSPGKKHIENRQQEVAEITRTLKIAAKELNVPIILLSQLSRKVEDRKEKKPQMSDLRESGAIEQDADIILFIYREHEPNDTSVAEDVRNKVELVIAKHRNGETGSVELKWDGPTTTFLDVDKSTNMRSLERNVPPSSNKAGGNYSGSEIVNAFTATTTEEIIATEDTGIQPDDNERVLEPANVDETF